MCMKVLSVWCAMIAYSELCLQKLSSKYCDYYTAFIFRADRQQMMAAATTEQPRRASGARADDAQVGLIDNETAISAEAFVGQHFQK